MIWKYLDIQYHLAAALNNIQYAKALLFLQTADTYSNISALTTAVIKSFYILEMW